jgi:hypothetical protein
MSLLKTINLNPVWATPSRATGVISELDTVVLTKDLRLIHTVPACNVRNRAQRALQVVRVNARSEGPHIESRPFTTLKIPAGMPALAHATALPIRAHRFAIFSTEAFVASG